MKKNHLQLAPRLFKKQKIRQIYVYGGTGIFLMFLLFSGAWFYLNLGINEEATAGIAPSFTSYDNQEGVWTDPNAWVTTGNPWSNTPESYAYFDTNIYGIVNYDQDQDETFIFAGKSLTVYDTLVIMGNLTTSGGANIDIQTQGVLIVLGNLSVENSSTLKNKGRVVVTQNLTVGGGGKVNNLATDGNGFYVYGSIDRIWNSGDYGKNHKSESLLKNQDNPLYRYVMGLRNVLLPVSLLDFSAQKTGNNILLQWSTASEVSNDFFTIERSADGKDWEGIKTISGAGHSNVQLKYQYKDQNPLQGYNYYRLKQTDFNGNFEYFKIVGINLNTQNFEEKNAYLNATTLQAGPNPFTESVTITYTATSPDPIELVVWDITGITIYQEIITPQPGKNKYTIAQAGKWRKGPYIIKMVKNGKAQSAKMIKI